MNDNKFFLVSYLLSLAILLFGTMPLLAAESDSHPAVPFKHAMGMKKYQSNCAGCHGKWLEGSEQGPPLMHGFYKPSHHGNAAFYRAALQGVRAHHWQFGDMPKVEGITKEDMDSIVPFIRWYQHEKGLY